MKEYDRETLKQSDGKQGQETYIAHGGRVIDVSNSPLWKGGLHMNRHQAGNDLTRDLQSAPHGTEVLDRYPQVGVLQADGPAQRPMPRGPAMSIVKWCYGPQVGRRARSAR